MTDLLANCCEDAHILPVHEIEYFIENKYVFSSRLLTLISCSRSHYWLLSKLTSPLKNSVKRKHFHLK